MVVHLNGTWILTAISHTIYSCILANLTIISNSTKGISRPLISNESEAIEAQVEEKSLLALLSIFFF